jgi:hypothetical protein
LALVEPEAQGHGYQGERGATADTAVKKKSLSQVKNLMHRALADLLDPPPSQSDQARLREHFGDRCCYCGGEARRHDGHLDHADPHAGNGLGNLLLACKTCNGNEKREMGWEEFLRRKSADERLLEERLGRIRAWLDAHPTRAEALSPGVQQARRDADIAIEAYAQAHARLSRAVAGARAATSAAGTSAALAGSLSGPDDARSALAPATDPAS